MIYNDLLAHLYAVNDHGGMKLGLENCLKMDQALGCPTHKFPSIHVAGTNGKGSTATKIATALHATGLRVGLYTSPHISCFRERICINGVMITEEATVEHLSQILVIAKQLNIPATFFELTTLAAFHYFAIEQVDFAVVETGLGGRLDATNIIRPRLSVITSISLEHTEILGNTIEEITLEKAGIIKPFTPVVIGPRVPVDIIKKTAKMRDSPCIVVNGVYDDFHEENKAIASTALNYLKISQEAIESGLAALPPCRMLTWHRESLVEKFPTPLPEALILDVAHNPDAIQSLLKAVRHRFSSQGLRFVIGLSKNKDIVSCLQLLNAAGEHIHLVEGANGRATSKLLLFDNLIDLGAPSQKLSIEPSVSIALEHAIKQAGIQKQILIVCGTFFIMADARAALGIQEARDFFII